MIQYSNQFGLFSETVKINVMRFQDLLCAILLTVSAASCQRSSAGVTIPPEQTFLLGKLSNYSFKAKLKNKGSQVVSIELRSIGDGSIISTVQLSPKQVESFEVSADQLVAMVNSSSANAEVSAKLNKTVAGMSYVDHRELKKALIAPSE